MKAILPVEIFFDDIRCHTRQEKCPLLLDSIRSCVAFGHLLYDENLYFIRHAKCVMAVTEVEP